MEYINQYINLSDPWTYVALYVVSVIIGIPTLRRMYKESTAHSEDAAVGYYFGAAFLAIISPVTIVMYWVAYKLVLYLIIYRLLFGMVVVKLGDYVLPDRIKSQAKDFID